MDGISASEYREILKKSNENFFHKNLSTPTIIKIIVYLLPLAPIFFYVNKSYSNDKIFMWNVRQSLVFQAVFFLSIVIVSFINLYSISTYLRNLFYILGFIIQFICAVASYNDDKFRIPFIYKYMKKFIEEDIDGS